MEFSKKYLIKYGWEEGEGLGKTKSGIKDAVKPKLKFDKAGIGFDPSTEFTDHWWIKVYDAALGTDSKKTKDDSNSDGQSDSGVPKHYKSTDKKEKPREVKSISDELYSACSGRTAHKGARHGLKLSGKLQRLEQQEKTATPKTSVSSLEADAAVGDEQQSVPDHHIHKERRKKKKKHKESKYSLDIPHDDTAEQKIKRKRVKTEQFLVKCETETEFTSRENSTSIEVSLHDKTEKLEVKKRKKSKNKHS